METITITPDLRLSIEQDENAENPETWGWEDAHTEALAPIIERWQDGEVYVVVLQRRETYTHESGRTLTVWEDIDALGGCYLDDDYTAQDVAAEHFSDFPEIYR